MRPPVVWQGSGKCKEKMLWNIRGYHAVLLFNRCSILDLKRRGQVVGFEYPSKYCISVDIAEHVYVGLVVRT